MKRSALLLFLLAAAVYLNGLPNDFTQDDFHYIVTSESIRRAPWRLFFEGYSDSGLYRPLGTLSYAANYAAGGLDPLGYHVLNLVLHGVVTVLLYQLLLCLLDRRLAALAAALLFAVHPIHSEAVAAAVGRTELLAAAFLLAAWLLHVRERTWSAAAFFLMALLSKESAAAFLALAPLGDFVRRKSRPFTAYAPYAGALGVSLVLRWNALGGLGLRPIPFLDNPLAELPGDWRVLNALHVAWKYVALELLPLTLSADYSFNAIPVSHSWKELLPWLLATLAVLAAWLWSVRRQPGVFLAGSIYLAGFALTSNVLLPIGAIMGERLAYFPSAGFCLLAGLGWEWLARGGGRRRRAAVALLAIVVLALAARTVIRNRDWRNNYTLFASAARAVPNSVKVRHNLGVEYKKRNEPEKARREFEAARRIYPEFPLLLTTMGLLYFQRGDHASAEQFLEEAFQLSRPGDPNYNELATHYAAVLVVAGRYDAALTLLDGVIQSAPNSPRAYANRAVARYYRHEWDLARADAETALRLDPENKQARSLLTRMK